MLYLLVVSGPNQKICFYFECIHFVSGNIKQAHYAPSMNDALGILYVEHVAYEETAHNEDVTQSRQSRDGWTTQLIIMH